MERIDVHPTHTSQGYQLRCGQPFPFGATIVPGGVNFSIYSSHSTACTLVLFEKRAPQPFVEIPFHYTYRICNLYFMSVLELYLYNL